MGATPGSGLWEFDFLGTVSGRFGCIAGDTPLHCGLGVEAPKTVLGLHCPSHYFLSPDPLSSPSCPAPSFPGHAPFTQAPPLHPGPSPSLYPPPLSTAVMRGIAFPVGREALESPSRVWLCKVWP